MDSVARHNPDHLSSLRSDGHDDEHSQEMACLSVESFWLPIRTGTTAWAEHAPFMFWLMRTLKPKMFVELGTHNGFSYFCACQAVRALSLQTSCFAIDTWTGDDHAGFYDESVYNDVENFNRNNFADFSCLIRSTFDEGRFHFSDGSIDLLHIDGRHRYEDVKHDFSSWLPKLSRRAVVLFHDTKVSNADFGVWKLWEEIQTLYPSFEFLHGYGLGVLAVGDCIPDRLRLLFSADTQVSTRLAYSCLGNAIKKLVLHEKMHEEFLAGLAERDEQRNLAVQSAAFAEQSLASIRREHNDCEARIQELTADAEASGRLISQIEQKLQSAESDLQKRNDELHAASLCVETAIADGESSSRLISQIEQKLQSAESDLQRRNDELDVVAAQLRTVLEWRSQNEPILLAASNALSRLDSIERSTSWRMLEPLRWAVQRCPSAFRSSLRRGFRMQRRIDRKPKHEIEIVSNESPAVATKPEAVLKIENAMEHSEGEKVAVNQFHLDQRSALRNQIARSTYFNEAWYRERYLDVHDSVEAVDHFLDSEQSAYRDPGPEFSSIDYLQNYKSVAEAGMNPLVHFIEHGRRAGLTIWRSRHTKKNSAQDYLQLQFSKLQPLPVFRLNRTLGSRVTLVTDSVNAGSLFGGVGTAIIFAALLAEKRKASLRVVTLTEDATRENVAQVLICNGVRLPDIIEFAKVSVENQSSPIDVQDNEVFVTTSWWSTTNVRGSIAPNKIFYLLQEDERMFYPYGDEHLRCHETLSDEEITYVINTKILFDHLVGTGLQNIANTGIYFEPAFPRESYNFEHRESSKKNFFFYARPNNARNIYYRGLEAIEKSIVSGVLDPQLWEFYFVGKDLREINLSRGVKPHLVQNAAWAEYSKLVRKIDLGLSLMYTPHPSYPPLDLAASGAVVITNTFENKKSLEKYSKNIICANSSVPSLTEGIKKGAMLANDADQRKLNYEQSGLGRSWPQAFDGVLAKLG